MSPKTRPLFETNLEWEGPTFWTKEPNPLFAEDPVLFREVDVTEFVSFNGYDKGRSIALVVREEKMRSPKYVGLGFVVYWEAYVVEVGADNTKTKIMDLHPKTKVELSSNDPDIFEEAMKLAEDWYFANAIALAGLVLR